MAQDLNVCPAKGKDEQNQPPQSPVTGLKDEANVVKTDSKVGQSKSQDPKLAKNKYFQQYGITAKDERLLIAMAGTTNNEGMRRICEKNTQLNYLGNFEEEVFWEIVGIASELYRKTQNADLARTLGDIVSTAITNAFSAERRDRAFSRASNSSARANEDGIITFAEKVKDYYGQSICMITGEAGAIAAHIIPASAKTNEFSSLERPNYATRFALNHCRNGLLLSKRLEEAFDQDKMYFVVNPFNHCVEVGVIDPELDKYSGMKLIYSNKVALPFRRALKYKFDHIAGQRSDDLGKLQDSHGWDVFETAKDLSDKGSMKNMDEEKDSMMPQSEESEASEASKDTVKYDVEPKWKCCDVLNDDRTSKCKVCQCVRTLKILQDETSQQVQWFAKAQEIYGENFAKYSQLIISQPLINSNDKEETAKTMKTANIDHIKSWRSGGA